MNGNAPKAIILTPTRELAGQIYKNLNLYGKYVEVKCGAIFGGVNERPQIQMLKKGVDILVATPGRFLDLFRQKCFSLKSVRYCVLDEADRMLDMGFLPDIERIVNQMPKERQTLLFSATLPKQIERLAEQFLKILSRWRLHLRRQPLKMLNKACFMSNVRKSKNSLKIS